MINRIKFWSILRSYFLKSINSINNQFTFSIETYVKIISKRYNNVQLFYFLYFNQQSHMIFIYLIKVVKQNQRILTLQKWLKSIYYRNSFEISKILWLSNLCQIVNWNVCEKISFNISLFVQLHRNLHIN